MQGCSGNKPTLFVVVDVTADRFNKYCRPIRLLSEDWTLTIAQLWFPPETVNCVLLMFDGVFSAGHRAV